MKLYEKAPPGAKAEHWVKSNKERFKKRYGEKAGERVLYAKAWKLFGEEAIDEGNPYAEKMERHAKWRAIKDANQKKAKEREQAKKDIERAKEMNEGMARWSKENGFEIAYDKHPESKKFAQAYHSGEIKDYEDHGNGWYTHKKTGTAFEVRRHRGQHPRVKDVEIHHRGSETPPMNEDAAPTNVMGASAADPNSPPIQGFSPMLHKKALKRKVKDVKLDRILALIRRGLK
jgi:hypothetical protein